MFPVSASPYTCSLYLEFLSIPLLTLYPPTLTQILYALSILCTHYPLKLLLSLTLYWILYLISAHFYIVFGIYLLKIR